MTATSYQLAFKPSGQRVYVANELDNTMVVYDYNATSGVLCERQIVDTLQPTARAAITGASCAHFHEEGDAYGFL